MAQTILGIDVGSYSIKVSKLVRNFRDFELTGYYEQPLVHNPKLTTEEAISATLKSILEKNELTADVVSLSLPSQLLSYRILELPFSNVKKIEQTIDYELEGFIPVGVDEVLVDYHLLHSEKDRSLVLTAYIPRVRFATFLELMQGAGVDPKYVGVDSIDLAMISQVAMVPVDAVYAILDVGHQKTNLCIMQGQKLKYARCITMGGQHITKAIQKVFRLNPDKAEGLKLDRGRVYLDETNADQISRICQGVCEELIVQIKQTYLGFKQLYPELEWSAVFLTGGTSQLEGFSELLSTSLKINVSNLDGVEFIKTETDISDHSKVVMVPSLTQTLKVIFSNKAIKINFRKGEFSYKRDIQALGTEFKQLGGWLIFILVLGIVYFFYSYSSMTKKTAQMNDEMLKLAKQTLPELKNQKNKSAKQILTIVNSKINEVQTQLDAIQSGGGKGNSLKTLLEVSQIVPAKDQIQIDIDNFSFTGDHLRLDGRTTSFESVDKLKEALSKSKVLKNVNTQQVQKGVRDEIKFTVMMDVDFTEEQ